MAGVPSGTSAENNGEMMRKFFILFFLFSIIYIRCNTITVAQDSTGDFTVIQEAIESASNNDTILVYPGTYYENIDYIGKTLIIGSLYMITGNEEYKDTTILDGGGIARVVTVENYESVNTGIIGFTICNGFSDDGGGILIENSYLTIKNCIIEDNHALDAAGGILASAFSQILLSGTTIRNNTAERENGGLIISRTSNCIFDSLNLCNIYGNYGINSCDIGRGIDPDDPQYFEVYLDTFSCLQPDRYFISHSIPGGNVLNWEYLDLHVNTAYYDFHDGDLYVSPEGDDCNSGTSPEEPMKTIAWAITRTVSNPDNPNTVHLLNGTYSPSLNDQLFPLNMKAHVSLVGDSMDDVILNGEDKAIIRDYFSGFEYELSNMTFISNPRYSQRICRIKQQYIDPLQVRMQNLKVTDSTGYAFDITSSIEFTMNNIIVQNGSCHFLLYNSAPGNHSIVENCQIVDSRSAISHQNYDYSGERARLDVINTLVADNLSGFDYRDIWGYNTSSSGYTETNLVNCTIMYNTCDDHNYFLGCVLAQLGGNFNIYNSCIYGNDGYQVAADTGAGGTLGSTINVSHSLIEGREEGIPLEGDFPSTLNWLYGNFDSDPMVDEDYAPLAYSPLIDAGTTELPYDIELPETDLAGNPRITGRTVDIGAFEFNPWGSGTDEDVICPDQQLYVYPNPAVSGSLRKGTVTISWRGVREGDIQFDIYNAKGQKVRSVYNIYCQQAGVYQADWNLQNERGNKVSSGIYYVRIKLAGNYQEQQKVAVIN